jgi:hypothetical protein
MSIAIPWQQTGPLAQGAPPPTVATAGYFAQGVITFLGNVTPSLANVSQTVTGYQLVGGYGVITTSPPLPAAPSAGDMFSVVPDCGKTLTECVYKYNNASFFGGFPFVPLPEMAA